LIKRRLPSCDGNSNPLSLDDITGTPEKVTEKPGNQKYFTEILKSVFHGSQTSFVNHGQQHLINVMSKIYEKPQTISAFMLL